MRTECEQQCEIKLNGQIMENVNEFKISLFDVIQTWKLWRERCERKLYKGEK